jgi:hypothetical protein
LDGRTKLGRLARRLERELLTELGEEPSTGQKLLVARIVRCQLQLSLIDAELDSGQEISRHTSARYGALGNQLRLGLRELGIRGKPNASVPTLEQITRRHRIPPA